MRILFSLACVAALAGLTGCGGGGGGGGAATPSAPTTPAADARNGSYRVYASNGLQYQLSLDFDQNRYTFTDQNGSHPVSNTFGTDASEAGSYFFKSDRAPSTANVSRFRVTTDAVVGAFPFVEPLAATPTYVVKPFIAARKLITAAAELDGTYNLFGISREAAGDGSAITQTSLSAGGTVFKLCNSMQIFSIANCPANVLLTYTVAPTDVAGTWRMVNDANPNDTSRFSVARIGNQNVYLSGGASIAIAGRYLMRIGVQDTPVWNAATGYGASTGGSWGKVTLSATGNTRNVIAANGSTSTSTNFFGGLGTTGPLGMRDISNAAPGAGYFAIYNTKLLVLVGGAAPSTTAGYLQINLLD